MTPEEVFARLRDIHAPEAAMVPAPSYDPRALLIFAAALAGFLIARAALRRLRAARALRCVDPRAPAADQRDALLRLLARRRREARPPGRDPPPDAAFARPDSLSADGVAELRRWVGRRIG